MISKNEPYPARSAAAEPTTTAAEPTTTAAMPRCWFVLELVSPRQLKSLYFLWLLVLCLCVILSALASAQFDCYDYCGQAFRSCSVFGVDAPATCINLTSASWNSYGPPITDPMRLRRFSRIVIAQPGSITVPRVLGVALPTGNSSVTVPGGAPSNDTIMLLATSFLNASFVELSESRSDIRSWPIETLQAGSFISLLLPEGFHFSPQTSSMSLRLRGPALFRNGSRTSAPYGEFAVASVTGGDFSMIFLSLSPGFAIAEVVVRYVAILVNLGFAIAFVVGYSSLDIQTGIDALRAFDVKAFALDYGMILLFQFITIIFCDPLAAATLLVPTNGVLRYWSDHFTYATYISAIMLIGMYLSVTMPFLFHAGKLSYKVILGSVSAAFAACYFVLDALIASRGLTTGLVFTNPQSGDPVIAGIAITGIIVVSTWCATVALFFVTNKHRIVWNHGKRLYSGRVRLRIVSLRLLASCVAMYAIYWIAVYIPIQVSYSAYVPIYGRSGIQDVVAATWISCLCTGLWLVRRFPQQVAPLRPQRLDNLDDGSVRPLWQVHPWNNAHFRFADYFSGYCFLTEVHKMQFARRHRQLVNYRSFFCWETANSCLSLSNEVYYDAPASSCFASIAADPTDLEACVASCTRCCSCCATEDEIRDADVEDAPDGVCENRLLNVEQYGFTLVSSVNVAGVQVIVAFMMGEDGGDRSHDWGTPSAAAVMGTAMSGPLTTVASEPCLDSPACATAEPTMVVYPVVAGRVTHVAVVFRGTANSSNAYTDATFTRTVFEAMADRTRGRAKVHSGFASCWSSLEGHVFSQIDVAVSKLADQVGRSNALRVPVVFTGHSLGGALAVLGAYAFCRQKKTRLDAGGVQVYTFGMPRVGNVPFVAEYNSLCPETYRVTNENDKVSEVGHCFRAHVGRTVVVDRDGNFMVEPNAIEQRYSLLGGGGFAVKNHFLYRYGRSFKMVFRALNADLKAFVPADDEASTAAVHVETRGDDAGCTDGAPCTE